MTVFKLVELIMFSGMSDYCERLIGSLASPKVLSIPFFRRRGRSFS